MTKRINKADRMLFNALKKAIDEGKIHLCLINSKVNIPGSKIYNPWEMLLPILLPVLLGLILIGVVGILVGISIMTIGIFLSSNLVKKKMEARLMDRALKMFTSDYNTCEEMWQFGGLVLVKADDKKYGCIAPEGDWKEFVVKHFAELMVDKKAADNDSDAVKEAQTNEKAA